MVKFKFKYIFKWNIFDKSRNISRQNDSNNMESRRRFMV